MVFHSPVKKTRRRVEAAYKTPNGCAPGYRESANGALTYVGSSGFSYSSSVDGTSGVFLSFSAQGLSPSGVSYRGHGLQLRCLSE